MQFKLVTRNKIFGGFTPQWSRLNLTWLFFHHKFGVENDEFSVTNFWYEILLTVSNRVTCSNNVFYILAQTLIQDVI